MYFIIFKPLPVKYGTKNLKDHIPSNSHPAEIKDTLLGHSLPIHFGKKIHCRIFPQPSVQRISPKTQITHKCDQRCAFTFKQILPMVHWYCSTFVHQECHWAGYKAPVHVFLSVRARHFTRK